MLLTEQTQEWERGNHAGVLTGVRTYSKWAGGLMIVTNYTFTSGVLATTLVPEEAMGAFKGENPNGTWTVSVQDVAPCMPE